MQKGYKGYSELGYDMCVMSEHDCVVTKGSSSSLYGSHKR
jgi:hypothetical protein